MSEIDQDADLEQNAYHLLTKIFYLLDDCDRQFFAQHGLSIRQFWALKHLDEESGRSMVDLSRVLFTDKSNMTGIVDRLERLDLAVRIPASHDRRVILIKLTPHGRRLRDSVNEEHEARIRTLMSVVSNDGLHTLLEHLSAIICSLEAYLGQKGTPDNASAA